MHLKMGPEKKGAERGMRRKSHSLAGMKLI